MTLLRTHFDGPGKVEKRIAHANNAMLHCSKESIFPFSSHVTEINACHTTLAQTNNAVKERNKAAKMLKGITTANPSRIAAMQNIHSNPNTKANLAVASGELSEQISPKSEEWRKLCRELRVKTRESEPRTQSQNQAETSTRGGAQDKVEA
jgi:hypothetical protein